MASQVEIVRNTNEEPKLEIMATIIVIALRQMANSQLQEFGPQRPTVDGNSRILKFLGRY